MKLSLIGLQVIKLIATVLIFTVGLPFLLYYSIKLSYNVKKNSKSPLEVYVENLNKSEEDRLTAQEFEDYCTQHLA